MTVPASLTWAEAHAARARRLGTALPPSDVGRNRYVDLVEVMHDDSAHPPAAVLLPEQLEPATVNNTHQCAATTVNGSTEFRPAVAHAADSVFDLASPEDRI